VKNSIPRGCHIIRLLIAGYLIVPYFLRLYYYPDNSSHTLEPSVFAKEGIPTDSGDKRKLEEVEGM
jgi:hypothetical protein